MIPVVSMINKKTKTKIEWEKLSDDEKIILIGAIKGFYVLC